MNPKHFGTGGMEGFNAVPMVQLQQAPRPEDVFDMLRRCQQRFSDACVHFQQAQIERATAEKELQAVSSEANQVINAALMDPTQPQQSACANPANGRY